MKIPNTLIKKIGNLIKQNPELKKRNRKRN